jgi:hypothetical protein
MHPSVRTADLAMSIDEHRADVQIIEAFCSCEPRNASTDDQDHDAPLRSAFRRTL